MKTGGDLVADALVAAGINFICTLPDWNMSRLIERIGQENSWIHVRLGREEEGVGICAGAYLTGKVDDGNGAKAIFAEAGTILTADARRVSSRD